ncbi:MAG: M1 family metallopeptidase, partial [Planctomycetota bacterium]
MPFGRLVLPALLLSTPLLSQAVDPARTGLPEKSAGVVSYRIAVRLSRGEAESPQSLASPADSDPGVPLRYLNGRARIRYRNITEGSSSELRFHLYLNAFRNLRSTHLRESERLQKSYGSGRDEWGNKDEFGWIRVDELELVSGAGGPAEKLRQEFISPDDGNPDDRTVLKAALPGAFEPGSEILLELRFTAKLPKAYRRTGWGPGNFFMVAQWFPKLGVLEDGEDGRSTWNCHQFHASTEFYADYGSYDVKIETPAGWPVGATGELRGEVEQLIDGYERRLFYQDDVHDFAWVTDKDYKVDEWTFEGRDKQEPRIAEILETKFGYPGEQLRLSDVKVRMLLHPEHATEAHIARHRRAVEVALSFFGSRYGRYPYKTLTVVDPCRDLEWRNLGGGMEYPTLITCGTPPILHSRALRPEGVTIHEFGHQFWYGLSGNNEFEHSWLDEGFNSYSEGRAQDLAYNKLEGNPPVGDPAHVSTFGIIPFRGRSTGSLDGLGSGAVKELTTLRRLDLEPLLELTGAKEIKALLESINFEGE